MAFKIWNLTLNNFTNPGATKTKNEKLPNSDRHIRPEGVGKEECQKKDLNLLPVVSLI